MARKTWSNSFLFDWVPWKLHQRSFYLLELPSQILVIDCLNGVFYIIDTKDNINFIFFDSIHCDMFLHVPYSMEIRSRIWGVNWSLSIEALFLHLSLSLSLSLSLLYVSIHTVIINRIKVCTDVHLIIIVVVVSFFPVLPTTFHNRNWELFIYFYNLASWFRLSRCRCCNILSLYKHIRLLLYVSY